MNSPSRHPALVSLAFMLPYSGVDHAGGQYLLHHYRVLAGHCSRVDAFAIDIDTNLVGKKNEVDIGFDSYRAVIVEFPKWRKTILGKIGARLFHWALPTFPDLGVIAAFTSSDELRERVRAADIVELQWFEYFYFARLVRAINPTAKVIAVAHDVPSQRIERNLSAWPIPIRRVCIWYVKWLERQMLRGIPYLAAHSVKDAELLAQRSESFEVAVLNPPMELDWSSDAVIRREASPATGRVGKSFGFVGALHRQENNDAALWLLRDIWPHVLDRCPDAFLYIIGSKPSTELQEAAGRFSGSVEVTGYVEDLEMYYDLFGTAVIPLRFGAGIKLKTVSAILAGKNIVATPVAVEGTIPDDCFYCVSDSAETLSASMVELAIDPTAGLDIAERARQQVGSRYSLQSYERSVSSVYGLGE